MTPDRLRQIVTSKPASRYSFRDPERPVLRSPKGLSKVVVDLISEQKDEPAWMRRIRHEGLRHFLRLPLPPFGPDLSRLKFDELYFYLKPSERKAQTWDDVPPEIQRTFNRLQLPKYEQEFLAGVGAQYDSENIYHHVLPQLRKQGVIFSDVETAVRERPDLVKKYFGKLVPSSDNKFAALNTAVWSGGSFIYVPPHVHVELPLQAYFRINASRMGQFERTLIIADEGSFVHYVEGCSAPTYQASALHSAVVEVYAERSAHVRYTTLQNWSKNVYNLVTKRARAAANATVEWVDFNLGSGVTMKYPAVLLTGRGARADILSMAYAGKHQHQDAGARVLHLAPETSSVITSKSVSYGGGRTTFRGRLRVAPNAADCRSQISCQALILDRHSASDTFPTLEVDNASAVVAHEASVAKISDAQMFYAGTRGIPSKQAAALVVNGFFEPLIKELPMEYAVEMNRLIEMEMVGAVG
ncbi:MAG: Fe-S cluster assembly protein SufB [Patescibacteria group bacterium]|nr:Fe-S cluster assembly protein SufB [Patescibacteria group bacterium]